MRSVALSVLVAFALVGMLPAQSPMPVIVPAMTPAVTSSKAPVANENAGSLQDVLKLLKEMKAANAETLRQQEATLEQLDALEKAANEIKIYTKRS
jgi:hypothetical protein